MKKNWLFFIVLIVMTTFLVGCPPPPDTADTGKTSEAVKKAEEKAAEAKAEAKEEAAKAEEKAALAMDPGVNPDILPPPRPAMETSPDLSDGVLVVNDTTMERMAADGVPSDVVNALSGMQGKEFTNAAEFAAAVRDAAGPSADAHMAAILRNALVLTLADAAQAPQGELSLREREVAKMEASSFQTVYFDFDKSEIKAEFEGAQRENAAELIANPDMTVTVEGHADERGTNEYNLALGQRRAEAVRRDLIARGVDASQLSTVSFGEERPVESGSNEAAWAKNRRGVIAGN